MKSGNQRYTNMFFWIAQSRQISRVNFLCRKMSEPSGSSGRGREIHSLHNGYNGFCGQVDSVYVLVEDHVHCFSYFFTILNMRFLFAGNVDGIMVLFRPEIRGGASSFGHFRTSSLVFFEFCLMGYKWANALVPPTPFKGGGRSAQTYSHSRNPANG